MRASQSGLLWHMPVNIAGIHPCFSSLSRYVLVSLLIHRLPEKLQPKVRVHFGSSIERVYKLESFGTPRDGLQLSPSNEPSVEEHMFWYRHCQQLEADSNTVSPKPPDVLFECDEATGRHPMEGACHGEVGRTHIVH